MLTTGSMVSAQTHYDCTITGGQTGSAPSDSFALTLAPDHTGASLSLGDDAFDLGLVRFTPDPGNDTTGFDGPGQFIYRAIDETGALIETGRPISAYIYVFEDRTRVVLNNLVDGWVAVSADPCMPADAG